MDGALVAAIGSTAVAIITGVWAWVNSRSDARDRKADRVEAAQAELIASYRADAESERARRISVQAEADMYERETDRLRDLLRRLIAWVDSGATPPPPEIGVTDLWRGKN